MKHPKKKKRQRPSNSRSKQEAGCQNPTQGKNSGKIGVLNGLAKGIEMVSIEEAVSLVNREDETAEIFGNLTETASTSSANREEDAAESFGILTETASSSSGSSGLSNCEGYNNMIGGKITKGSKGNKVVAATGMVSTVLGKDYVPTSNKRRGVPKWKDSALGAVSHEDAEQFLCSMLSGDCELGMEVVKDVLCQSAYDVEKALDSLLELTAPSSELFKSGQHHNFSAENREDTQPLLEFSYNLTDTTSDSASSSGSDHLGNVSYMGCNGRNYFDVLASSGTHPLPGPKNASELTQEVLESLFNTPKSSKHEPNSMNWRNVVKKIESFGQRLDHPSQDTEEKQHLPAKDDYQGYRNNASQHWDSMKSYYHKAATAYASGKREYAAYLSDQGRVCNKMARQADERAGHDIFNSRNKSIENVITIDLHGQHVKQGMRLLKLHLLFGAYVRSVRLFRVITGCGSHGLGKSKLKQSVVNLLENEKIEWREENKGTLIIKLSSGQREFSFLDSESDTD